MDAVNVPFCRDSVWRSSNGNGGESFGDSPPSSEILLSIEELRYFSNELKYCEFIDRNISIFLNYIKNMKSTTKNSSIILI